MPTSARSPHRFLVPQPTSAANPVCKPASNLRHTLSAQTPQLVTVEHENSRVPSAQRVTPARRFFLTPRTSTSRGIKAQWAEEGRQSSSKATPRSTLQRHDSIDEGSEGSRPTSPSADFMLDTQGSHSIKATANFEETTNGDDEELLFRPQHYEQNNKRRRLYPPSSTPAPSRRFYIPSAASSPSFTSQGFGSSHPHFLLPAHPPSPIKADAPLPETFSPSRKGHKFIPGGLASTLQSWIIETANTGHQAQTRDTIVWGRDKEHGVKLAVRVEEPPFGKDAMQGHANDEGAECFPGGVVFVKGNGDLGSNYALPHGTGDDVRGVSVLLAGNGSASRSTRVRMRERDVVGIRAPLWEVDVGEQKWIVGVDWVIL